MGFGRTVRAVEQRRAEIIRRSRLTRKAQIADNELSRPGWSAGELGNWALAKQHGQGGQAGC